MIERIDAVFIGASAGGIEAVSEILSRLDSRCGVPVIVVIHLPRSRDTDLVSVFQSQCALAVVEVEDKQPLVNGQVFVAPPDYHVLVEDTVSLALSSDEQVNYSRPSIDVLFESAADVFSANTLGIVLSGANRDGAFGLAQIIRAGGIGLIQAPDQASSPTMPAAAITACPTALIMKLQQIADYLNERVCSHA